MLSVRDLRASYGSIEALQGTSLEVREGELVGLVGHNGVGKSTTLKAIAGVLKPTGGRIEWLGEPLRGGAAATIRAGIAYVPEDRRIFGGLSVEENLRLGATTRSDADGVAADVERELERFPALKKLYKRRAGNLSGGEQQMLAISRALISRPKLLLLDEPTLGLAPIVIDTLFATIASLRDEGLTVLLVEQNVRKTIQVADRAYVMAPGGRIELEGAARELERSDAFRAGYLSLAPAAAPGQTKAVTA
ncbi:ABC transporter ATP-binding protein [Conexibacter woesei]|uniref:ABC transporter related protein n=1 Tax=Conexibacter woesei (strain DSM 14684 / CCUG 47730 / CIP 108061 / JCM 11494 / NBRC 100937 / ID131577) TaxID=469383 RepID=D3F9J5_CONWI|nr:ABC transporter ATP-binding protein [Conexibacter woesei]ADB51057.1 ABC transporter related protein [Conexibacter woesei DSM 14684]